MADNNSVDLSHLGPSSESPDLSHLGPKAEEPKETLSNTILTKIAEGLPFVGPFSDELAGALSAAGKVAGVEHLGGKLKDIGLSKEGPTLSKEALLNAYREERDKNRAMSEQMQKERPGTSTAAQLVGMGLGTMALGGTNAGSKLLSPLGNPASNASLLTKVGTNAVNALPMGAAYGLGNSNADLTKGEVGQAAQDTATGAALMGGGAGILGSAPKAALTGGLVGAGLGAGEAALNPNKTGGDVVTQGLGGGLAGSLVGAGLGVGSNALGTAADKYIGTKFMAPYAKGLEGINITKPEYGKSVVEEAKGLAQKGAVEPVLEQKARQAQELQDNVQSFNKQINDLQAMQDEYQQNAVAQQTQGKNEKLGKLSEVQNNLASKFQQQLQSTEKDIGEEIGKIYADAGDAKRTPVNTSAVIATLKENLPQSSSLSKADEKMLSALDGDVSLSQTRELRDFLWGMRNDPDTKTRQAVRMASQQLGGTIATALQQSDPQLAQRFAINNAKYSTLMNVRDEFDYKLDQNKPIQDLLQLFQNANRTPSNTAQVNSKSEAQDKLTNLLNQLKQVNPDLASKLSQQGGALSTQLEQTQNITPAVPTNLPGQDKMAQLQSMLEQAKNPGPQPFSQFNNDPLSIAKKFLTYLQNSTEKKPSLSQQAEMDKFFDDLTATKGEDFANQVKDQMGKIKKDYEVFTPVTPGGHISNLYHVAEKAALKSSAKIGNKVGLMQNAVENLPSKLSLSKDVGSTDGQSLLRNGITRLSNASSEDLKSMADTLDASSPEGQQYSEALRRAASTEQPVAKNALIFSLMQQPQFRKLIHHQIQNEEE